MKKFQKSMLVFLLGILLTGCGSAGESENTFETAALEQSYSGEMDEDGREEAEGGAGQETDKGAGAEPASAEDSAEKSGGSTYIDVPDYSGKAYIEINGNIPFFTEDELSAVSYESYAELDDLGRCGVCTASVGQDIMPTKERESIGSVKPTGWHTVKYEGIVDGNYLYNRCHLIGYQLTGENANRQNLITGTRYMNVEGMLPFENMVADYVKETGNHVMYRVTPLFDGDNLVADGVLMEAESVEDNGADILFNVFCYNVQPGISIDYATGESSLDTAPAAQGESGAVKEKASASASQTQPEQAGGSASQKQEQTGGSASQPQGQTGGSASQSQQEQTGGSASQQQGQAGGSASQPEPEQTPQIQQPASQEQIQTQPEQTVQQPAPSSGGNYAVNAKNGKIHIVGACPATGTSSKAMTDPVYFNTYEEAEAYSASIAPNESKRQCGNCW